MEDIFAPFLELILDLLVPNFHSIKSPVLQFILQILAMILICAIFLALFVGVIFLIKLFK